MNKTYVSIIVICACLGAVGTTKTMNVQPCASLQNGAVQVLYCGKRGHDGHILDLEITANDMRKLSQAKKQTEKQVAQASQSTSNKKTVKKTPGETKIYYLNGYKSEEVDWFFKFDLPRK